jgi:tetratricopeptide (TPR) repeat protein
LALQHLEQAEQLLKQQGDMANLVYAYTNQGEALLKAGQVEKALLPLQQAEALENQLQGSAKEKLQPTYQTLQQVYAQLHLPAKAAAVKSKATAIESALAQSKAQARTENQALQVQIKNTESDHYQAVAQSERDRNHLLFYWVVGLALAILGVILVYSLLWRKYVRMRKLKNIYREITAELIFNY